jgi:hypothetical protein
MNSFKFTGVVNITPDPTTLHTSYLFRLFERSRAVHLTQQHWLFFAVCVRGIASSTYDFEDNKEESSIHFTVVTGGGGENGGIGPVYIRNPRRRAQIETALVIYIKTCSSCGLGAW